MMNGSLERCVEKSASWSNLLGKLPGWDNFSLHSARNCRWNFFEQALLQIPLAHIFGQVLVQL